MSVASAAALLRRYAEITRRLGSGLTSGVLDWAAADLEAGGPVREALRDELEATAESAMPLRFAAALHRLVLEELAPALEPFYPTAGGQEPILGAAEALQTTVRTHAAELPDLVARPCQTNEVGRCAALVVGFLEVARRTGLPLRTLEIGASAGLNLRWDRYRYESGRHAWGPAGSPVRLVDRWEPSSEFLSGDAAVVERGGCDPHPIDPVSEDGALSLRSSVWADQTERVSLLDGALAVAAEHPVSVEAAPASAWLGERLAEAAPGTATVVFHSVVWQYLDEAERAEVERLVGDAGRRATDDAPLAWLRMEPEDLARRHRVDLDLWPGELRLRLAKSRPHGEQVTLDPATTSRGA